MGLDTMDGAEVSDTKASSMARGLSQVVRQLKAVCQEGQNSSYMMEMGLDYISLHTGGGQDSAPPLASGITPNDLLDTVYRIAETSEDGQVTLLFTGESGSGKSTRIRQICASAVDQSGLTSSGKKLDAAIEILRLFGNAKTPMNDDSSRFSCSTKLLFDGRNRFRRFVIGVYMLEDSRAVSPPVDLQGDEASRFRILTGHESLLPQIFEPFPGLSQAIPWVSDSLDIVNIVQRSLQAAMTKKTMLEGEAIEAVAGKLHLVPHKLSMWVRDVVGTDRRRERQLAKWRSLGRRIYEIVVAFIVDGINEDLDAAPREGDLQLPGVVVNLLDTFGSERFHGDQGRNLLGQFTINVFNDELHAEDVIVEQVEQGCPESLVLASRQKQKQSTATPSHQEKITVLNRIRTSLTESADHNTFVTLLKTIVPCNQSRVPPQFTTTHFFGPVTYTVQDWVLENRGANVDSFLSLHCPDATIGRYLRPGSAKIATKVERDLEAERIFLSSLGKEVRVVHCLSATDPSDQTTFPTPLAPYPDDITDHLTRQLVDSGAASALEVQESGLSVVVTHDALLSRFWVGPDKVLFSVGGWDSFLSELQRRENLKREEEQKAAAERDSIVAVDRITATTARRMMSANESEQSAKRLEAVKQSENIESHAPRLAPNFDYRTPLTTPREREEAADSPDPEQVLAMLSAQLDLINRQDNAAEYTAMLNLFASIGGAQDALLAKLQAIRKAALRQGDLETGGKLGSYAYAGPYLSCVALQSAEATKICHWHGSLKT
ncbi:hypothetical protein IAU60_006911 [Kwoniella sp. DSM 27419]